METKYWTLHEFAEHARMHLDTARRYVREGRIAAVRIGRRYLLGQSEVEAFMKNPTPPARAKKVKKAASAKVRAKAAKRKGKP